MFEALHERWYMWRNRERIAVWHRVIALYAFVFITWGFYRAALLRLPVWLEELVVKGLVFGLPVFWLTLVKEKRPLSSLGITGNNIFESVYVGIGIGVLLGLVGQLGNFIRYGTLSLEDYSLTADEVGVFLILALVTAFWEGLLFFGYILPKVAKVTTELRAATITSLLYSAIHLPALVLIQQAGINQMVLATILLGLLGFGCSVLMFRYQNLAAPIMAQALWGVTVFLFR